ncbi:retinol dehydrogenase 16 isoform X4 [Prionailurus bengalensis]|uniref:retinol dehydrogenase 16 isoform X4 n=1 Tax=Prionailurus bengalensis TaxID=37029 RepID=UPI001CA9FD75|nr:retinol dehydrogenase 16 isoform X4 [Prionailurus bengalensis]
MAPLFRRSTPGGERKWVGGTRPREGGLAEFRQGTTRGRAPPLQRALGYRCCLGNLAELPLFGGVRGDLSVWTSCAGSQRRDPQQRVSIPLAPLRGFSFWAPQLPGLWGLVNNAGISIPSAPNEWLTKQDFMKILDVNLLGLIEVTLNLLPLVRKARGRVVNISSIMGRVSLLGGSYCISKYGVEAFSDSLRRELSYFGVKVAVIEPGFFNTGVTNSEKISRAIQEAWDQASPEVKEIYGEKFLASVKKSVKKLKSTCCNNLYLVTNCVEHALTACHPRTRYSSGWDAKLLYLPMSYMPTLLVDAMIYWMAQRPIKAL